MNQHSVNARGAIRSCERAGAVWVTHSGAFHRMEDMALEPRSVQQPHLPIWTGAMWNGRFSKRMLERTARWADGFHPHGMTPRGYAEGKAAIEEMAAGLGRDPLNEYRSRAPALQKVAAVVVM